MKIWIDADGCPKVVKEIVFKAADRLRVPTILVANHDMSIPRSAMITKVLVKQGFDVADHYIVERAEPMDLIITADLPLAADLIAKEAYAISPRGELYVEENIRERLSIRNFMQDLRDHGEITGGPPPLGDADKRQFASTFDRVLTLLRRGEKPDL